MINPLTGGLYFSKHNRTNPIENTTNELNPYYKPVPSKLSFQERIELIKSVGEECIMPEELELLVKENRFIYCYDGFEPSG